MRYGFIRILSTPFLAIKAEINEMVVNDSFNVSEIEFGLMSD
jgi:hypothetical protein